MSVTIDTAFINTYKSNVIMLAQQKGSRLKMCVRNESQKSEADFYERIGAVDAQDIVNRHGDSPIMNTPHSRRMVTLLDAEYGDLIDKMDRVRMLIDPQGPYTTAAVYALARKTDDRIIAAALGNAYSGKDGTTAVALPTTQKIAAFDGTTTTGVGLNVKTLVATSKKFDDKDVDESIPKYFAFSSHQKQDLLNQTEVTSEDYASVKALVSGMVDSFMGFKFIRTQRLVRSATDVTYTVTNGTTAAGTGTITAAKSRRCFAWAEDGLVLASGLEPFVRIAERSDKRFSMQVYCAHSIGATRLEEEKVVEVICSEN
jgi:hypothetical protein